MREADVVSLKPMKLTLNPLLPLSAVVFILAGTVFLFWSGAVAGNPSQSGRPVFYHLHA